LNKPFGKDFRIPKGIESAILADSSLDYPVEVLSRVSISWWQASRPVQARQENQADRLLRVTTGRQLMRRPECDIDVEKVLRASTKLAQPSKSTPIRGGLTSTGAGTRSRSTSAVS
jgi:hypothetical protein